MKLPAWIGKIKIGEVVCNKADCFPEFDVEFEDDIDHTGMFYGISNEEYGTYGSIKRVYKPMKYRDYIHELKKQVNRNAVDFIEKPFKKYSYITARVKKGVVRKLDQYLMILDTDGVADRARAIEWLDKRKIGHFSIQSSPNRFWVVCDRVGLVSDHTHMMDEIPGVDTAYIDCSRKQNVLLYRGFPKPGFLPEFEDTSNLKGSHHFRKWILSFQKYWESEDVLEIANNLLVEAI